MEDKELKRYLHQSLVQIVEKKVNAARLMLKSTLESRDNETKSSVGDKHETGRAMMQREEEQNRAQLSNALELTNILSQLDVDKRFSQVEFGSLVTTNHGKYFLAIGLGKIVVAGISYFAISPASPMGKVLLNKVVGDRVLFLQKEYVITQIE
ncbi:MAG: 3-oxoacyl-ACP synthase [Flavobacteriales bacterium]|nr:3-oxoacyl-ACP synthase [Flavobacteriales bacterium]PCH88788.1 MAG: 3-oxoacyl-ACP synthase [Flavobacteriales bacterium]